MTPFPPSHPLWQALARIPDPEIPVVNVVEMGIVRAIEGFGGQVRLTITPTFSACPALHQIRAQLEATVRQLGFEEVEIQTQLSPPWSTDWLGPETRAKLQRYGIAPPKSSAAPALIELEVSPTPCPRCGSLDTTLKNTFGSTLCKSMYVCNHCLEPFEGFKTV